MAQTTVTDLVGVAYTRQSQASGRGASEDAQDEAIRDVAERLDIDLRHLLPFDEGQSSFTLERPSFKEALRLLAGYGTRGRLIVSKLNRLTRRRKHWEEILDLAEGQGWKPVSAEFPELDLLSNEGRMIAGFFIDQGEREYRDRKKDGANSRRTAVLKHGVHGGDKPPFGYKFTVRGYDKKGRELRGPLVLVPGDARKVREAFEARAGGASWKTVVRILGAKSLGSAVAMLRNRAHLGEARSGEFVKKGAHPAIVDEDLFNRANRRKVARSVSYGDSEGSPLGGGILRCASCTRALTRDTNPRGDLVYRCRNAACNKKVTIAAGRIEPHVLELAKGWHAAQHPDFALTRAVEDAMLPALEDAHREAQAEVEKVKADHEAGLLSPSAFGLALTAAEKGVEEALRAVETAEAGRGWLGTAPERVEERLASGGIKQTREFVAEMVKVVVFPVGRGNHVPVKQRIKVQYLTAGKTAEECGVRPPYPEAVVEAMRAEMATWPEPGADFTYRPGDVPVTS